MNDNSADVRLKTGLDVTVTRWHNDRRMWFIYYWYESHFVLAPNAIIIYSSSKWHRNCYCSVMIIYQKTFPPKIKTHRQKYKGKSSSTGELSIKKFVMLDHKILITSCHEDFQFELWFQVVLFRTCFVKKTRLMIKSKWIWSSNQWASLRSMTRPKFERLDLDLGWNLIIRMIWNEFIIKKN